MSVSRTTILAVGALFSAYHIVLGSFALRGEANPWAPVVAMVLYGVATLLSLWPLSPIAMTTPLAAFNVGVVAADCFLVTSQLEPGTATGYETWHVAAAGTLMTITAVRRQYVLGWVGIAILVLQSVVWGGLGKAADMGVLGSVVWVALANMVAYALAKAARDARQFALAEREAVDWQAAQEAHLYERQFRLVQTSKTAESMLQRIVLTGGNISEQDRAECFILEGALRDEIRGRRLLNDAVRREIMAARRRGASVQLLDEGGVDDLDESDLQRVLAGIEDALHGSSADRIIIRTVPSDSDTAVTIVGLRSAGDGVGMSDDDEDDDELDLWLEIPRHAEATAVAG
ncbi:hypothetical protein L3i23_03700 [Herbiconiux sp. L3-i23]|nr:hypothetical protein L3i23_03700 [Herbiconiux sp. L3-i23]